MPYVITQPDITISDSAVLKFHTKGSLAAGVGGLTCQTEAEDTAGGLHATPEFTIADVKASLPGGDQAAFEAAVNLVFGAITAYSFAVMGAVQQP
jgi:hypothetical protein